MANKINYVNVGNSVSVIICCYNASARIIPTLKHLQEQSFNNPQSWEVIVIDNASTDQTALIAEKTWEQKPVTDLIIAKEEKPGLMHARKRGLMLARYNIVSFIDDDNWVEQFWVQKIVEAFSIDEKIGVCGGKSEAVFEREKPNWFDDYQSSFAVGAQAEQSGIIDHKKGFLWGAGLSFRKSLWDNLTSRGFQNLTLGREGNNITAGEDTELCYAIRLLGYNLYYREDLSLKHFMPANRMNINYLKKMSEGFGKAYARLNSYRVLLDEKFKLYPWWYEWLATKKRIISLSFSELFARDSRKKIRVATNKAYLHGYAKMVWSDKNSIRDNIKSLKKTFL